MSISKEEREKINQERAAYKKRERDRFRARMEAEASRRESKRRRLELWRRTWEPTVGVNEIEADFMRATGIDMIDLDRIPARLRDD